jgi:hypothetical protein
MAPLVSRRLPIRTVKERTTAPPSTNRTAVDPETKEKEKEAVIAELRADPLVKPRPRKKKLIIPPKSPTL